MESREREECQDRQLASQPKCSDVPFISISSGNVLDTINLIYLQNQGKTSNNSGIYSFSLTVVVGGNVVVSPGQGGANPGKCIVELNLWLC